MRNPVSGLVDLRLDIGPKKRGGEEPVFVVLTALFSAHCD
jgi:hypothetical protein